MRQPGVTHLGLDPAADGPSCLTRRSAASQWSFALLLAVLLGANPSAAQESNPSGVTLASRVDARVIQPRLADSLTGDLRRQLKLAFNVALGVVRSSPRCAALFNAYGADGVGTLANSRYTFAGRLCKEGVVAYTAVGSPATWVCPGFARLSPHEGAVILVHEALHGAGMTEWPQDPDGPTSLEINRVVRTACGL